MRSRKRTRLRLLSQRSQSLRRRRRHQTLRKRRSHLILKRNRVKRRTLIRRRVKRLPNLKERRLLSIIEGESLKLLKMMRKKLHPLRQSLGARKGLRQENSQRPKNCPRRNLLRSRRISKLSKKSSSAGLAETRARFLMLRSREMMLRSPVPERSRLSRKLKNSRSL